MSIVYVIGGANGSGKTTSALRILPRLGVIEFVNRVSDRSTIVGDRLTGKCTIQQRIAPPGLVPSKKLGQWLKQCFY